MNLAVKHPPHLVSNAYRGFREGHDQWLHRTPDQPAPHQPARVPDPSDPPSNPKQSRDWSRTAARKSRNDLFAAVPESGKGKAAAAEAAAKDLAGLEKKYARASPSAARAVPFAPDGAAPRRRPALLRRPVLRCAVLPSAPPLEPPCATVAAARALHHALRCLPCAGRLSGRKRRRCKPKRATRTRAHCGTVRPRTLALCGRPRLCASSLRWRAHARSTRWVGFLRGRLLRRNVQRRWRSIACPGNRQSRPCLARG